MKSAGLSSTYRNMLKKTTKIAAHATRQENQMAARERQKTLRMQAAKAQFERLKKESQPLTDDGIQTV